MTLFLLVFLFLEFQRESAYFNILVKILYASVYLS